MTKRRKIEKIECPRCHKKAGVRIIYGCPSYQMYLESKRDGFILGGCCVMPENRHCVECGFEWVDGNYPSDKS